MIKITSRAALVRAISLPGVKIEALKHWQPLLVGTTRTPKTLRAGGKPGIQGNGYYFDGQRPNPKNPAEIQTVEMWADTPPASKLKFNEDGTVTYYPDTNRSWTLRFTEDAQCT